ncbi:MAG: CoA transferase, partial [Myxococcota bacterium]
MLSPYRVLDLTNEHGLLCGQLLADLGADVIQVEPPGGSSARRVGPWWKDERGLERSLFWWAYTRNKRGIVLDLEAEADVAQLRELAAGADFFIESQTPGRLAELGLGYDDLAAINPGLVYVSISPFGQQGPKAGWQATDLTVMAASGCAYLSGDAERPPIRVRVPQAHAHAGADAAVAALIAHAERRRSGRGQHVDISAQQSATLATMFRILDAPLEQAPAQRVSGGVQVGKVFIKTRYPLADGWVILGP